ncbi:hypothetical protein OU798_02780 [Prolixibacteraceae bacterium Z1-6]|uniref:Uncharacterized protein n=1 Tax=Draconibacterium aestuarii TaxID=2998507 RepID=A0A9X3F5C2_9BACT|nr:hypothetical protein [Prolixibacteraceae bacterium Z1-6]
MRIDITSKETIVESLELLANDLILNKVISINDSLFSMIDLEVYYWFDLHQDDYARGVKHLKPFGEFEAHRYGIDLSLGNQVGFEFGGILICGLYDITNAQVLPKSEVKNALLNQLNMGYNRVELVSHKTPWSGTFKSQRMKLGVAESDNQKQFEKSYYKFLAKDSNIFKSYKGKETIFRNSDLTDDEIEMMLGYKLKR